MSDETLNGRVEIFFRSMTSISQRCHWLP